MDDLYSLLDQADPQTLQLMLQALNSGETMGMGAGLMQTPGAEGRNVGRTYVASSPLEHLASASSRGLGAYMMNKGQQQRGAGIQAFINALRQPPQQPVGPVQAPELMEPPLFP